MDTTTKNRDIPNIDSRQFADICHKFLVEPWEKYHCGYRLKTRNNGSSDFHSIRTSLIPEYKDESEVLAIKNVIYSILELQKCINRLISKYSSIRKLISESSPRSEVDIYSLLDNDPLFSVQRIDYIVDQNNLIKVIDPNILPLGLGLFSLRDLMMRNHLAELESIVGIDIELFQSSAEFNLEIIVDMFSEWLKKITIRKKLPYISLQKKIIATT